jgi:hypothetical protein
MIVPSKLDQALTILTSDMLYLNLKQGTGYRKDFWDAEVVP